MTTFVLRVTYDITDQVGNKIIEGQSGHIEIRIDEKKGKLLSQIDKLARKILEAELDTIHVHEDSRKPLGYKVDNIIVMGCQS